MDYEELLEELKKAADDIYDELDIEDSELIKDLILKTVLDSAIVVLRYQHSNVVYDMLQCVEDARDEMETGQDG